MYMFGQLTVRRDGSDEYIQSFKLFKEKKGIGNEIEQVFNTVEFHEDFPKWEQRAREEKNKVDCDDDLIQIWEEFGWTVEFINPDFELVI